jgi:hypothetical protein
MKTLAELMEDVAKVSGGKANDYAGPNNSAHKGNGSDRDNITIRTAASLRNKVFEPLKYIVTGYLVEGATIFAGAPKIGKSWLMLNIGLAVARGGECLGGIKCEEGDVLYLAFEDNERRLQSRITRLIGYAEEWPERFNYAIEWPRAHGGGLDKIREWIASVEKPRLVVVDVLAAFRSPRQRHQDPYEADYAAIHDLQAIASQTGIAIVIVHHVRKSPAEVDPFERISGTTGQTGAADTGLVLDRDGQGTTLYGRGRDIEEYEVAVEFVDRCRWRVLGPAVDVRRSDERGAILSFVIGENEPVTIADIVAATGMNNNNVRQLLLKMVKAGEVLKTGRGRYLHPSKVTSDNNDNKVTNGDRQEDDNKPITNDDLEIPTFLRR